MQCGSIIDIVVGTCTHTGTVFATINFSNDEARVRALMISGQVHDGYPIHVKGHPTRYITDTSAILKFHSEVWSGHWKVGDPQLTSDLQQTIREAYHTLLDTPGALKKDLHG